MRILILIILFQTTVLSAQNIHDCIGAVPLCGTSFHQPPSIGNVGNIPNEINPINTSGGCLTAESGGIWYSFTPYTSGIFHLAIIPDNPVGEDFDWALFDLTGTTCAAFTAGNPSTYLVSGNTAGDNNGIAPWINQGPTGINSANAIIGGGNCIGPGAGNGSGIAPLDWNTFNVDVTVQAGNDYVLYVAQFSGSQGYTIDLTGTQAFIFDTIPPTLDTVSVANCSNQITFSFDEEVLCSSIQNNEFTITGPGGPYAISGVSSAICAAGGTYDSTFTATVVPAFSLSGAYVFHFDSLTNNSVEDACGNLASSTDINFSVVAPPDPTIGIVLPLCIDDAPITLNGQDPGGNWSGTGITDSINGIFDPSIAGVGSHTITYSINGSCIVSDNIIIIVNPIDDASFSYSSTNFCLNDSNPTVIITGLVGGNFTINNSGVVNLNTGDIDLVASGSGSFTITYTTSGPCQNSSTFDIVIEPCTPPTSNFSSTATDLCINDCINFNDLSTDAISLRWYFFAAIPPTSLDQNPSNICYDSVGTFGVALVSENSFGQDSLFIPNYIVVDSCNKFPSSIIIPNVFSPNEDGFNDFFIIDGASIDLVEMKIFNRWGKQVFKSSDINNGWDGKSGGSEALEGTYFYVIIVILDEGEKTFKGGLTLTR